MEIKLEEMNSLRKWTKEYLDKAQGKIKAVVGLSGGIDSAVTAAICVDAVGPDKVLGVILPCESPYEDTMDAMLIAQHLGINALSLDLEGPFRGLWDSYRFQLAFEGQDAGVLPAMGPLVKANAKARMRMTALYMVANHVGGFVVGTTNKTEALLGYATKYGDGGVDIEPLMDFYKTEIWEIGKLLNIPEKILKRVPTAGLWEGQTDEGELGMTYKEIDRYLMENDGDYETATKVEALIEANKHKDLNLPHFSRG